MWSARRFAPIRIVKLLSRIEPQTFSLSRKRVQVRTEINVEGPPVKAVPEGVRSRHTLQSFLFQSGTRMYAKTEHHRHQKGLRVKEQTLPKLHKT